MESIMLIDFGSTFTKVTGVDLENEIIIGTSYAFTTIETDVREGLSSAINKLERTSGNILWGSKYACSSAAGGLRMIGIGLVEELTSKAAKEAALSAGAKVLKVFSMELTEDDISDINNLKPDILLLTGGTDGGNQKVVLHNAMALTKLEVNVPVIYSGNRSVKNQVVKILDQAGFEVKSTENVMPKFGELNIDPARAAIQEVFLNKIIEAKGIKDAESMINNVLMPTPLAVMKGAELLADGYDCETGYGDMIVVDIGGATTDIHSICEGLPTKANVVLKGIEEPRVKRSVEGDLGARYSLAATIDLLDENEIVSELQISYEELKDIVSLLINHPEMTSNETEDNISEKTSDSNNIIKKFDEYIAKKVIQEGIKRHSGRLKEYYTPFGMGYEQQGKDLTDVTIIVGTGGPLIHSENPIEILKAGNYADNEPFVLKPTFSKYYLDQSYILAAMGLLSEIDREKAYRILNKYIIELF